VDNVSDIRNSSLDMLAPAVKARAEHALFYANTMGYYVRPFETYRSPARHTSLYALGRTKPGNVVTHAKAWESFHQYGVALDVVFFVNGRWSWDSINPWDKIAAIFKSYGFTSLPFEKAHFEINGKMAWQEAYNLIRRKDMNAWYNYIANYCAHL